VARVATAGEREKLSPKMVKNFHVRPAIAADADTIAWHRARMFQDMGDVPPHLFEEF